MTADPTGLGTIVALLVALSVASERLVEIIKGFIPYLERKLEEGSAEEGRRSAIIQIMAVGSGIFTAWLASDYLPKDVLGATLGDAWSILGLGLLASGGSGFWNSVLTYVTKVKDIKKAEAKVEAIEANRKAKEAKEAGIAPAT